MEFIPCPEAPPILREMRGIVALQASDVLADELLEEGLPGHELKA
jgi:hypothetical protein